MTQQTFIFLNLRKNPKARVDPKAFVEGRPYTKQDSGECFLLASLNPGSETHEAQELLKNDSTSLNCK